MDLARPVYRPPSPPATAPPPRSRLLAPSRARPARGRDALLRRLPRGHARLRAAQPVLRRVSTEARAAEWGRQHGLGGVVTWIETEWYKTHPAKTGGAPPPKSFGSGPDDVRIPKGLEHLAAPATIVDAGRPPAPRRGRLARRRSPDRQGRAHGLRGLRAARPGAHELRRGRRVDGPDAAHGPALLGVVRSRASAAPYGTPRRSAPRTSEGSSRRSTRASGCRTPTAATTPRAGC